MERRTASSHSASNQDEQRYVNARHQDGVHQAQPAGQLLTRGAASSNRTASLTRSQGRDEFRTAERRGDDTRFVTNHHGIDLTNFQTARLVTPPTYRTPLHRQLATMQNADQAKLIRSLNLCRETHRYQTFNSDWPLDSAPSGSDMAASGWFYLGNLDRTQCFSCGGVLRNWRRLDNPNTEHISHFPHCSMAQGRESRNIPDASRQGSRSSNSGMELTAQRRFDLRLMFPCEFPVTASMGSVRDRVNSFNNWCFTQATPQTIAEAGFYSLGVRDRVKCFYCNGGLQHWQKNDNPWEEHAKWYPTCEFLLQQRGPEYIHTIVARFPNINRPILHAPGQDVPPPLTQERSRPNTNHQPSNQDQNGEREANQSQAQSQDPLNTAMQSEVARFVIDMGFDESVVRQAMRANIEQHGVGFQTATALLEAAEAEQRAREADEERRQTQSTMETNASGAFLFDVQTMENGQQLDLYESSVDSRSVDLPTSGFEPSTSSSVNGSEVQSSNSRSNQKNLSSSQSGLVGNHKKLKEQLEKELQDLQDQRRCKVCLDSQADVVFIPCGHICCCLEFTRALKRCPMCRVKITQAMKTYSA